MNDEVLKHWPQISAALDEVLLLPEPERDAWLQKARERDAATADRVGDMLRRSARLGTGFLASPRHLAELVADDNEDQPGDCVGPYRLLQTIGSGGMGTVWLAERVEGITNRRVALKLPRHGWSKQIRARLNFESEVLATLEHPGIARLYDAGETAEGRPYLAIEYVEGKPIDVYCRHLQLNSTTIIALLLKAANVLGYAHGKLVVHSDLKPRNLLVRPNGDVSLLDFGIARILAGEPRSGGQASQTGDHAGFTPIYASPEQLRREHIGVASDIYSLGVIGFELLCGRRPFDGAQAHGTQAELARKPNLPSRTTQYRPASELKGDIDAVLLKALSPLPGDRYANMAAFANDLQAILNLQPVAARPLPWYGHTAKFVRRNAALSAAFVVSLLAVGAGLSISMWQARVARQEAARAEQVKDFVASILVGAVPVVGERGKVMAVDLLSHAKERMEIELANSPRAAAELGVILADSYRYLGRREEAEQIMQRAAKRAHAEFGPRHMITLRAQEFLIERLRERNPSEVVRQIPRLIDDARALQPESNVILVDLLHTKARAESVRGNRELALDSHEQAVSLANTLLGPNDRTTIAYLANQSVEFGARGEYAKQLETARDAHRRAVARLGKHRPDVVLSLVERSLGDALRNAGHIKDSIATHQRVVADFTLLDGFASNRLRQSQGALALALLEAGDFPTALDTIKATIASGNISGPVSSLLMSDISLLSTMALILQSARRSQPTDNWSATHLLAGSNADALPRLLELELRIVEAQEMTMSGDYSSAKSALGSLTAAIDPEWPHLRADLLRLVAFNARMQGRPMQVDGSKTDTPLQLALASARPLDRIALLGEAAASAFAVGSDAEGIQFGEQCGQLAKRFKYPFSAYLHDCAIAWTRVLVRNQQLDEAATVVRDLVSSWAESNPGSTWHGEALCCLASVEQRRGDASQATNHRRLGIRFMASSIHPGMRGNKSCDAPM